MRSHDEDMICGEEGYEALISAVADAAEPMPAEARAAVRERLLRSVKPAAVPLRQRVLRPFVALATTGALLGGVSYAAAASAPGETLFGLKQSIVSTVRSAQRVLSRSVGPEPVPAVLKPLEAPGRGSLEPAHVPQLKRAVPKTPDTTPAAGIGRGKSKGQGKGKAAAPKGRDNGNGKNNGNGNGGARKPQARKTARGLGR